MSWVRIDDRFYTHPKVRRAWRQHTGSIGLHLMALCYCSDHLTDGLVDRELVKSWAPHGPQLGRMLEALCSAGLWSPNSDGWEIHDYLEYNPSRAEVQAKRAADAARKRGERPPQSERSPNGVPPESSRARPRPVPTRPLKERNQERKKGNGRRLPSSPSHDEANQAGLSWAAYKAERLRHGTEEDDG